MTWKCVFVVGLAMVWLAVMGATIWSSLDSLQVQPWGNPIGDSVSAELVHGTSVGQLFTAPMPGLYAIDLYLDEGTSKTQQYVAFHLKDHPAAANDIWSTVFTTESVGTGQPVRFEFERIPSSKGESYYFYVDSPAARPGDAIAVRVGETTEIPDASAVQDGAPVAGNLQFMTLYDPSIYEKTQALLARIADGRPYWFGTAGFYVVLGLLFAFLLGAYLWQTAGVILGEWENKR